MFYGTQTMLILPGCEKSRFSNDFSPTSVERLEQPAISNVLMKDNTGPTQSGIIAAALKRSNVLNQEPSGSISSSKPTALTLSKLICLSNVK